MNVKLVADSSANLHTMEGMRVSYAPMKVVTDAAEYIDDDNLDVPGMIKALREYKGKSSSACPSISDWIETFEDADMVLGVSITSNLSGCYNSASIAAAEYMQRKPDAKVFILDSLSTGPEMQLILEKYHELVNADVAFDEICAAIKEYLTRTHLIFSLESLDTFAKNGRVSPIVARAAGVLGLRIVGRASAEGTLEPMHKCRGEKKALQQLLAMMKDAGYHGGKVRLAHAYNPEAAEELASMIRAVWPDSDITITLNRGLCCYYAEAGGLLVGFEH